MRTRLAKAKVVVRPLDPDDPRSIDHPSHKEQWLELARVLGRAEAREEYRQRQLLKDQPCRSITQKKSR